MLENASSGTDHGAAGLVLVLGEHVRGGLHGRAPSLETLDQGDLVHTVDFRSVYARLIAHAFGLDPRTVLGAPFPEVELV